MSVSRTQNETEDLRRIQVRVFKAMRDEGPLTADDLARQCLPPAQVLASLPIDDREGQTRRFVDALVSLLEEDGSHLPMVEAVRRMRKVQERTRDSLEWQSLPPVVRSAAVREARRMTDSAEAAGWITTMRHRDLPSWTITPMGGGELDRLERELAQ